ncbi:MAG: sulfatase-like hydrolase/transferase [Ruminococcaceae bacterium]|nr:sulfatase-like hydrolase/transferase [Oscillospiraceae bacterium]
MLENTKKLRIKQTMTRANIIIYTILLFACTQLALITAIDSVLFCFAVLFLAVLAYLVGKSDKTVQISFLPTILFAALNSFAATQLLIFGRFALLAPSSEGELLYVFGFLSVLIVYLFIYGISGSCKFTVIFCGIIFISFGIANNLLYRFRGTPLYFYDLKLLGIAATIIGRYTYSFDAKFYLYLLTAISGLLVSVTLAKNEAAMKDRSLIYAVTNKLISKKNAPADKLSEDCKKRKKSEKRRLIISVLGRTFCLAAAIVLSYNLYFTSMLADNKLRFLWNRNMFEKSAFLNFSVNAANAAVKKPEGYSLKAAEDIKSSINSRGQIEEEDKKTYPTVIVILSESFADIRRLGDIETSEDFMPFISNLQKSCVRGTAYSSVIGGGTANTEYEFLTGNSLAFIPEGSFPYNFYIHYSTNTLVSGLKSQGYKATSIHPYHPGGWNRARVYKHFGFGKSYWLNDFKGADTVRGVVSDKSNYDFLINLFEKRKEDDKNFYFNITMQNHSGYNIKSYEPKIFITKPLGNFDTEEQYLTLLKETDTATKGLIEYFEKVKEPVIILFAGDHQPKLSDSFYNSVMGDGDELCLKETQKKYAVDFFIWSNYKSESYDIGETSMNYLAGHLLSYAGLNTGSYGRFLAELQKTWPAINAFGALNKNGNWYTLDDPYFMNDEKIKEYKILQYNHLFDPRNTLSGFFWESK